MIRMRMSDGKERKRNIDPHNPLLAAHLLILSECRRPGLFHPPSLVFRSTTALFLSSPSSREHAQRCAHIISR